MHAADQCVHARGAGTLTPYLGFAQIDIVMRLLPASASAQMVGRYSGQKVLVGMKVPGVEQRNPHAQLP